MVTALLRRELGARLAGDKAAEDRLLSLKFARLVIGVHPIGNLGRVSSLHKQLVY